MIDDLYKLYQFHIFMHFFYNIKEIISQTLYALFKIAKENIFEEFPKLPEKPKSNKI